MSVCVCVHACVRVCVTPAIYVIVHIYLGPNLLFVMQQCYIQYTLCVTIILYEEWTVN